MENLIITLLTLSFCSQAFNTVYPVKEFVTNSSHRISDVQAKRALNRYVSYRGEADFDNRDVWRTRLVFKSRSNVFPNALAIVLLDPKMCEVHSEIFFNHSPSTTMIEIQSLILPELLIEVEAEAYVV